MRVGPNALCIQLLCNLAALLIEYKHDYDEAEKCYKLALDCDPLHVNAMVNYGWRSRIVV